MQYRALVVDDELATQRLVMRALKKQDFQCDVASDGDAALERVAQVEYDVVVTDLRMPNQHGHALTRHLLMLERRPVIVIHTGVIEPRLAEDLLARGVDDIIFKPFGVGILGAKVKALVQHRFPQTYAEVVVAKPIESPPTAMPDGLTADLTIGGPVSLADLKRKLKNVPTLMPISTSALDVYKMTNDDITQTGQLAAIVQCDAAFAAEVLRLANCSISNSSQQPITDLDRAIRWIGRKRIGQLALGMNSLSALTCKLVPWMDVNLAWNQSMAAGLAVEMLIEQGGNPKLEDELLLSAVMYPLGRVVLGMLYPRQYDGMVKHCHLTGESLLQQERVKFPLSHTEVLAHLLDGWNIPKQVQGPLQRMLDDYSALAKVPEPIRRKTELVKLAAYVGWIAVGRMETWDWLDVPRSSMLKRLGITDLNQIIEQTKADLLRLAALHPSGPVMENLSSASPTLRQLGCCDLSSLGYPFLETLLSTMGILPIVMERDEIEDSHSTVLVNCIGTPPGQFAERTGSADLVIVTDAEFADVYKKYGRTIVLPCSYGSLRDVCKEVSQAIVPEGEFVGSVFAEWA